MRQTTLPEQTAKLIELGFEKPSPKWVKDENGDYRVKTNDADYDISELIEMLPKEFDGELLEIASVTLSYAKWVVRYPYGIIVYKDELIDAL